MNIFETLKRLSEANGVAGDENSAAKIALEFLKEYDPFAGVDNHGSVTGFIGEYNDGRPTILLDAHIDEIGLIVTYIDDKGFIKAEPCGGMDRRVLPAQAVTVHGKSPVKAVVCSLPLHVKKESELALKADDIWIDTGFSKDELLRHVSLGDRITINSELTRLFNDNVCGRALDNRAGVTAVLYALSLLKNSEIAFNIVVAFSTQEEVGCRGARISAYNSDAEYSIVVDVSYSNSPGVPKHKSGKLGGGPMIGIAPTLNREMGDELKKFANEWEIDYQLEIMNRDTGGTNADEISLIKGGVRTALVSIPLRYMHMPVETCSLKDIEAVGHLIAAFIEGYKTINNE
ncbi:MAG: M20/M25/M40 family metallo-hydrolase [Oscillospiraceae bacterium]|nr:M20/M25/M40 family metallo-hydrolase [Oscillospiraceae bacterium]